MIDQITIECPECHRSERGARIASDYPEAVLVKIICPKCDDGDFHECMYFDANGKHIVRDPDSPQPGAEK